MFIKIFNEFRKAVKTKGNLKYFNIPTNIKPTKKTLARLNNEINDYEELIHKELIHKEGRDNYKSHLNFLKGIFLETKKQIYPDYKLTDVDKKISFKYVKYQLKDLERILTINKDDEKEIDRVTKRMYEILAWHFKYVWGIEDEFIIRKLTKGFWKKRGTKHD